MAWVRIDDHFDEHPKMQKVGPLAWGVWLAGLAYCNRNLTDGFIPWAKARSLCSFDVVEADGRMWSLGRTCGAMGEDVDAGWIITLLLDAGLWEEITNGQGRVDGYRVHDYPDYQPLKEQVLKERERNAQRQAKYRERNTESNGVSNDDVTPLVTDNKQARNAGPVPVPSDSSNHSFKRRGAKASAPRDEIFEAVVEVVYGKHWDDLSESERGRVNKAAAELRVLSVPATPDEIRRRAAVFRQLYPDAHMAPESLPKNWTSLGADRLNGRRKREDEEWRPFPRVMPEAAS